MGLTAMANRRSDFVITNKAEVRSALRGIPDKLKKRILPKAIRDGLRIYVRAVKGALRSVRRTGLLAKAQKSKVKTYPSGITVGLAGTDRDTMGELRGKLVWPNKYAHLVEYGTKSHSQPKRKGVNGKPVRHPGSKAVRYQERTWRSTKAAVAGAILLRVKSELTKVIAKQK